MAIYLEDILLRVLDSQIGRLAVGPLRPSTSPVPLLPSSNITYLTLPSENRSFILSPVTRRTTWRINAKILSVCQFTIKDTATGRLDTSQMMSTAKIVLHPSLLRTSTNAPSHAKNHYIVAPPISRADWHMYQLLANFMVAYESGYQEDSEEFSIEGDSTGKALLSCVCADIWHGWQTCGQHLAVRKVGKSLRWKLAQSRND
ncbi:hypothetical protein E2P81_ATG10834 [Venturia nashicola]|uniref:Uncharacterized protein n=1 Tax=Venturia nashicola TaxID=86259 RepID=A0A4Z1NWJ2_9PEZI|nr:hypothetical protein E6O75_ATG10507 [Venturia nashicola]TLD27546.1 hypothetical protein E2P81_ATG10834 [Venturia nashicola]